MEFPLEPIWMGNNFEFSEPDFYKQVTDRGSGLTGHKTYTVPVGWCSLNTSQEKQNYWDMLSKAFTSEGKSNKKKEQVPDEPIIKYSQGMQNSCMISSLASALYYMGDVHASKYIIRRKQLSLEFIRDKVWMQFLRNTLMRINRKKRIKNILSYSGMETKYNDIWYIAGSL